MGNNQSTTFDEISRGFIGNTDTKTYIGASEKTTVNAKKRKLAKTIGKVLKNSHIIPKNTKTTDLTELANIVLKLDISTDEKLGEKKMKGFCNMLIKNLETEFKVKSGKKKSTCNDVLYFINQIAKQCVMDFEEFSYKFNDTERNYKAVLALTKKHKITSPVIKDIEKSVSDLKFAVDKIMKPCSKKLHDKETKLRRSFDGNTLGTIIKNMSRLLEIIDIDDKCKDKVVSKLSKCIKQKKLISSLKLKIKDKIILKQLNDIFHAKKGGQDMTDFQDINEDIKEMEDYELISVTGGDAKNKSVSSRKKVLYEYLNDISKEYKDVTVLVNSLSGKLAKQVKLTTATKTFKTLLSEFQTSQATGSELTYVGLGVRSDVLTIGQEVFLSSMKSLIDISRELAKKQPQVKEFGAIAAAVEKIIQINKKYSQSFIKLFGGKKTGGNNDNIGKVKALQVIAAKYNEITTKFAEAVDRFDNKYYGAEIQQNLKQTIGDARLYGQNVKKNIAGYSANKIEELSKNIKIIQSIASFVKQEVSQKESMNMTADYYKKRLSFQVGDMGAEQFATQIKVAKEIYNILQATNGNLVLIADEASIYSNPIALNRIKTSKALDRIASYSIKTYNAVKGLYDAAQAVELFITYFTVALHEHPEYAKEILNEIKTIDFIKEPFTKRATAELYLGLSTMKLNPKVSKKKLDTVIKRADGNKVNETDNIKTEYVAVHQVNGNDVASIANRGSIIYIPDEGVYDLDSKMRLSYTGNRALKNILQAFANIGDKIGKGSLKKSTFMTPLEIYNKLSNYMIVTSLNVYGTSLRTEVNEHDELFTYVTKSLITKILNMLVFSTLINKNDLLVGDTNVVGIDEGNKNNIIKVERILIGGIGKEVSKVYPDATALYFRLPLLAKTYIRLFNNNRDSIQYLPMSGNVFAGFMRYMFSTANANNRIEFNINPETLVYHVNKIWEAHGSKDPLKILFDFKSVVNKSYGKASEEQKEEYRKLNELEGKETLDLESLLDYSMMSSSILADEGDLMSDEKSPSDELLDGYSFGKVLSLKISTQLSQYRKLINSLFNKLFDSIGNAAGVTTYTPQLNVIKRKLHSLKSFSRQLTIVEGLVQGAIGTGIDNVKSFDIDIVDTSYNNLKGILTNVKSYIDKGESVNADPFTHNINAVHFLNSIVSTDLIDVEMKVNHSVVSLRSYRSFIDKYVRNLLEMARKTKSKTDSDAMRTNINTLLTADEGLLTGKGLIGQTRLAVTTNKAINRLSGNLQVGRLDVPNMDVFYKFVVTVVLRCIENVKYDGKIYGGFISEFLNIDLVDTANLNLRMGANQELIEDLVDQLNTNESLIANYRQTLALVIKAFKSADRNIGGDIFIGRKSQVQLKDIPKFVQNKYITILGASYNKLDRIRKTLAKLPNTLISGWDNNSECMTLLNIAMSSMKTTLLELSYEPKYYDLYPRFINEFKTQYDELPYMPLQFTTMSLISKSMGRVFSGSSTKISQNALQQMNGMLIFNQDKLKESQIPYLYKELEVYNNSATSGNRIDRSLFDNMMDNMFTMTKFGMGLVAEYRDVRDLINVRQTFISMVVNEVNDAYQARINKIILNIPRIQYTKAKDIISTLTVGVAGADVNANIAIEKINIIDMNMIPLNINALMRTIPFLNIINYGVAFDKFIGNNIGNAFGAIGDGVVAVLQNPYYTPAVPAPNAVDALGNADLIANRDVTYELTGIIGNQKSLYMRNLYFIANLQKVMIDSFENFKSKGESIGTKKMSRVTKIQT